MKQKPKPKKPMMLMGIFKEKDKNLDSLYNAVHTNGRINELLHDCYEYGKLTPKKGKQNTCKKLKKLAKKNQKELEKLMNKKK